MEKENKGISNKLIAVLITVFTIVILILLLISFVLFKKSQSKKVKVKTDTEVISIVYAKESNGLNMKGYVPLKDEDGKKLDKKEYYFDFNVKSHKSEDVSIDYELSLSKDDKCNLSDKQIKVYLEKENEGTYVKSFNPKLYKGISKRSELGTRKGSMILFSDNIVDNVNDKYRLRVWVDEKAVIKSPIECSVSVNIYAKVVK